MFLRYGFILFASTLAAATAHAAVYTVGGDGACNYTGISAAAAAAEAHPGADTINVASPDPADPNAAYTNQEIGFTASQELDIVGGFANCSQAASSGSHTIIDGAGGVSDPVFRITVPTGGVVKLSYLTIQHGDEDGSGKGGGIYFKGNGILELNHATVTQNTAAYGGGIYAEGTGTETELIIGEDVAIVGNTARLDGGGIVNDGTEMTMIQPDSYIAINHAPNGYGGGLLVRGDIRKAYTYLGTSGLGSLGAIYLNNAKYGGGVALHGQDHDAVLHLFTTDAARPMHIKSNTAAVEGGGIYLADNGWGSMRIWYALIDDNIAPDGAAIANHGGTILFNEPGFRPLGSLDCPVGIPCGGIVENAAEDASAQPAGAIVKCDVNCFMYFNRMKFERNTGQFVLHSDDHVLFHAHHVAITSNIVSDSLIATGDGSDTFDLENTTIAGNSVGNNTVLRFGNSTDVLSSEFAGKLYRTIIWQPGKTTLHLNGGPPLALLDVMVSERGSVDGGNTPYVTQLDPKFVDPAHDDYSLIAGSPAIDYSVEIAGDSTDLYGNPRDVDLPIVMNFFPRDLGAIERQTLQPLVLNSDFDADLRLWGTATAGSTAWDSTQNRTGAPGSGSAHVTASNAVIDTQTAGIVQCLHIPGPGDYALNGFGKGTGTAVTGGDIAELRWEFRKSGGANCRGGAPDATEILTLSNSSNWTRAAMPAHIVVSAQDFTYTSSIAVILVAQEHGPSGPPTNAWFDGITLSVAGDDTIFANGFENP